MNPFLHEESAFAKMEGIGNPASDLRGLVSDDETFCVLYKGYQ